VIIKGRSRGGAASLASYLSSPKNERAVLLEVRGTVSDGLRESLREMEVSGLNATQSEKVLYHAQIAPRHDERLSEDQWKRAVGRLEDELGLSGQPRAVVLHQHKGAEHAHVVWSRADLEAGKCIHMSWDNRAHHKVARELEREFGLQELPEQSQRRGNQRSESLHRAQESRDPATTERIQKAARVAYESGELANSLQEQGLILAKGDRRAVVVHDPDSGETYSLSRLLKIKTKEMEQLMGEVELKPFAEIKKERDMSADQMTRHLSKRKAKELVRENLQLSVANSEDTRNIGARRSTDQPEP